MPKLISQHTQFLSEQFGGSNWVLARRSANIVRRYGSDVICVSKKQYAQAERDYRELFGDPSDPVRAELYLALDATCETIKALCEDYDQRSSYIRGQAALKAERNA